MVLFFRFNSGYVRGWLVCGVLWVTGLVCSAQSPGLPDLEEGTGLGAYSRSHFTLLSTRTNLAAMSCLKNPSLGFYGERQYLLGELNQFILLAGIPSGPGSFGLNFLFSGFSGYQETNLGLIYARSLGNKIDAGSRLSYHRKKLSGGYGRVFSMQADFGLRLHFSESLVAGIQFFNPARGLNRKRKPETTPFACTFGLGFEPSPKFYGSLEIKKAEGQPAHVIGAIRYSFIPALAVQGGFSTAQASGWVGADLKISDFRVGLITRFHPSLGMTPGIMLLYEFKRGEK